MSIDARTELSSVSKTLLIPLKARAFESQRRDRLFHDAEAIRALSAFGDELVGFKPDRYTQVGIAIRTEILDEATSEFLCGKSTPLVVNLGAGLCTRYHRLHNSTVEWIELDLPEVVALRRSLFQETERHRSIARSVLDFRWMEDISPTCGRSVLFIAEGLLMYLWEDEVKKLLFDISQRFPGSEIILEAVSSGATLFSGVHPSVGKTGARFHWGIASGRQMERWNAGIRFRNEQFFLDRHPNRWGWLSYLRYIGVFRKSLKIIHLELGS